MLSPRPLDHPLGTASHSCSGVCIQAESDCSHTVCVSIVLAYHTGRTTITSSANKGLMSSLAIWIPLISISCLIAVAETSHAILNRYGHSGQSCLVPDVKGNILSLSSFKMKLAVELL